MWFYNYKKSIVELDTNGYFISDRNYAKWLYANDVYNAEAGMINSIKCGDSKYIANKSKIFLDVGAHHGMWSFNLAPFFKETYAFEPNSKSFNYLCANIAVKDLHDTVNTHRFGIGDSNNILTFYKRTSKYDGQGGLDGFLDLDAVQIDEVNTEEIEVRTIDSLNIGDVGFIKIDVEGFEENVILGAKETIKKSNNPPILFESWYPGKEPWDNNTVVKLRTKLLTTLQELGYNQFTEWLHHGEMILAEKVNNQTTSIYYNKDKTRKQSLSSYLDELSTYIN